VGTGGHGHTFPGAVLPFGAVQLSPDTYTKGWDWCSGYHDSDTSLMGFSHTHLSGTGCSGLLDILLIPNVGEVKWNPGSRENPSEGYRAPFKHADEKMEPGFYSVPLNDRGVMVELTTTERVGMHRYTFAKAGDAHVLIDFAHGSNDYNGIPCYDAVLEIADNTTVVGGRAVHDWANGRHIYFAAQFSKPFKMVQIQEDGKILPAGAKAADGMELKTALHFDVKAGEVIQARVSVSGVSSANALSNIQAEAPTWEFDGTRKKAKALWQAELARIRVEIKDDTAKRIFYSSLYHMMIAPSLFDDANGQYYGMDGQVHHLPQGQHNFTAYSLWDTFRALHPSFTLFQQERVPLFVNSLIEMAEQSPAGMPVWPLHGKETGTMTGYHSATVIGEACAKGFTGIDYARAYKPMRKRNMDDDWLGLPDYRKLGYIRADKEGESVSKLIEYGNNDWAVSKVAEHLGHAEDAQIQRERSKNYKNVFDPKTQFIRARLSDGKFTEPFDPIDMGHTPQWRDYTESNAWQSTFGIQHDVKGYMNLWGGREPFIKKLDALFTVPSTLPADAPPDIAGLVGQYAHGNEPSHHIAFLYIYGGQPWKSQERVISLLKTMYKNEPDGLQGNEDCGQMSAWFVMSAMGLYAVDPASANYVLNTPLVDKATIQVKGGKKLTIEAKRPSADAIYIQSVTINGKKSDRLWVKHEEIASGGSIVFELGTTPNKSLGAAEAVAPPSLTA
jgi:predicted alpha-1,2-mannosidase